MINFLAARYWSVFAIAVIIAFSGCKTTTGLYQAPNVQALYKGKLPAPQGMVYIPSGTILFKGSLDSTNVGKNVSVSAFFIDETEVTNKQYREFVNWVADSIAVTDFLKDDRYFLEVSGSETAQKRINWTTVKKMSPLWKSNDPAIQ